MAVEYIERLSDFYRSILQYRDKEVIPLQEEIELVNNYNFLLKKRFGSNFKLDIQADSLPVYVVPLTLQMLIENAIKHNIVSKTRPLYVTVAIDELREYIIVSNNLQRKIKPEKSTHFGLQSLEKRYALLSGKRIKVQETGKSFQVYIPIIEYNIQP
jgi:LytS/YehU family sensor histidine kinase